MTARGSPANSIRRRRAHAELEAANRDVAQRIVQAIETINGVLTGEDRKSSGGKAELEM